MKIDRDEVVRIASLASLEFEESELERTAEEMSQILDYVDALMSVDVSGVSGSGAGSSAPLRPDRDRNALSIDEVGENAPAMQHGHFVVPKVIGGD